MLATDNWLPTIKKRPGLVGRFCFAETSKVISAGQDFYQRMIL
jgi:hypothetical protein